MPLVPPFRLLALVLAVVLGVACGSEPAQPSPPTASLDGEVRLSGVVLDPSALTVKVRPLAVATTKTLAATRVEATSDRHVLRFHFDGLVRGVAYQLGIGGDAGTTVKWRSATRGLFVAGRDATTNIEGFHPSVEIEVLARRPTGDVWVGADTVDLKKGAAPRKLRARSSLATVTDGVLEVSTEPFLAGGGCKPPKGVVATRTVPLGKDFTELPDLDVGAVLAAAWTPSPSAPRPPGWYREVARGAPLYLRVVPRVKGTPACSADEGEPGSVLLAQLEQKPIVPIDTSVTFTGEFTPAVDVRAPSNAAFCVSVTKSHTMPVDPWAPASFAADPFGTVTVFAHPDFGGKTYAPGDFYCFPPPDSDGFFDSLVNGFTSLVTGLVDGIASVVNTIAAIWEEIKGAVVSFVADAISALGIPCNDDCRAGITFALNAGLAALGLPPSLPNFDQLSEQGLDYLVAAAAEQYGVPPDAAKAIVKEAVSAMQKSQAGPATSVTLGADWVMVDDGFRHATVVAKVSAGPLASLPDDMILISDRTFQGSIVPLPKGALTSGKTLTVPMVLPLDVTGLAEPPSVTFFGTKTYLVDVARWYRAKWFASQIGACVQSQVFGLDEVANLPIPTSRLAAFGFNASLPTSVADGTKNCP